MTARTKKWLIILASLSGMLVVISLFSLSVGAAGIPFKKILPVLFAGQGSPEYTILMDIRIPRILLGIAVGGALSIAGVILQGLFRNPLVEPYTLGISGGAALGVSLNIVLRLYQHIPLTLPFFGMMGAGMVIVIIYAVGMFGKNYNIQRLLLIGVMISFISSSVVMLIMSLSRSTDMQGILFWTMGSLEEPNVMFIGVLFILSVAGLLITSYFANDLNVIALGEEEAFHLGLNVQKLRRLLFIVASVLTGFCVSVAGIIGFVGLVVPHFVRLFFGSDHRIVTGASFLCGAIFLILCDMLARSVIPPLELPVGVVTGILGGGLFIYALVKK